MEKIFKFGPLRHVANVRHAEHSLGFVKPLSAGIQDDGEIYLWAVSNPVADHGWEVVLVGTGWEVPERFDLSKHFVGTVQDGIYVWHVLARPLCEN